MRRHLIKLICLAALTGCSPLLHKARWTPAGPGRYTFEDADLRVVFELGDRSFGWAFHNKRRLPMEIDPRGAFFLVSGDDTAYTLWGARQQGGEVLPPILVRPGGYTALTYPVLYRSPLYPFPPRGGRTTLFFSARWDQKAVPYELDFPLPDPPPETEAAP